MGEVVLAHDERLGRLVAIKRLHAHHAATPERRERFRREARIAARLNHPAIVQLHDVRHEGDHDYLIMEYIDGRTLRERRAAGPMTLSEVLGIAHQIALGMAAAHDLGVIHRDLKPENILITPAGRAKIADFGIAKLDGDDTITTDGAVVGTFRAMSPEQAQGHAVDHRSDLFSFGILMYEALAGVSPFRADTPFLTVQRLVAEDPQPIAELVPMIPDGLASLVHQLLAKEPLLRPRDFHEVAGALAALAGQPLGADALPGPRPPSGEDTHATGDRVAPAGRQPAGDALALAATAEAGRAPAAPSGKLHPALADTLPAGSSGSVRRAPRHRRWYAAAGGLVVLGTLGIGYSVRDRGPADPPAPAPAPPAPTPPAPVPAPTLIRVAVLEANVGADCPPDWALRATDIRNVVITGVGARVGLELIPQIDIDNYVKGYKRQPGNGQPEVRKIRDNVGADESIEIHILCVRFSRKITLKRDANRSSSPRTASFSLSPDTASRPDDTVAVHLNKLYPDRPVRDGAAAGSLDPHDYERFVRLVHDYWAGNTPPADKLLAELAGIRERSPRSLDVLLFEAEVHRHWYEQTQDPKQAQRAIDWLRNAEKLFPDTYSILSAQLDMVLAVRQLEEASAILERLDVLDPDSSVTHLQRGKLHYARGELDQARRELDEAAQRDSVSWRVPYYRAVVARKLRDRAATRAAIDDLLRRAPDNYAGLSLRAREELDAGKLACAEQIYARLVAREPLYAECAALGYTRIQLGRYREAADSLRCTLDRHPHDLGVKLNLAESLLLAGDLAASNAQLRELKALLSKKRGESPAGDLAPTDLMVEAQTLAYLGRDDPALAGAARSRTAELLTHSKGAEYLYTAALVHAVLRDRDLAAHYVTKYLDGGGDPAELGLRWFDDLRRDPVLGPRLDVPSAARSCEPAPAP